MNSIEYERLALVEREHWFYRGKREIVRHWLRRYGALGLDRLLVDVGAGSGYFAYETKEWCKVLAVDDHPEALSLARDRLGQDQVLEGSGTSLPLQPATADCITALDVLEHIEDDKAAVAEMTRVLKPGGILVVTVPALMTLWSDWDVALHHFRRYSRTSLRTILVHEDLELLHCHYINVVAFPAIWTIRKLRALGGLKGNRSEDMIPPPILNSLLRHLFVRLACQSAISFPFGVGLVAVARRKGA